MNTVKLYKVTCTKGYMMDEQGEGFSLKPWGNDTSYYEGYDDGGQDYILPEGYEVAMSQMDEEQIYNQHGEYCTITTKYNSPCLVTSREEAMLTKVK